MSDPTSQPTVPQPFSPEASPAPGGGCSKPVFVGCGLLLAVVGIAGIVVLYKAKDLVRWGISLTRSTVVEALPADVTDDERRRLEAAFDAVGVALADGEVDLDGQERLQSELYEVLQKIQDRTLEAADVTRLTRALEEIAGVDGREPSQSVHGPPNPRTLGEKG